MMLQHYMVYSWVRYFVKSPCVCLPVAGWTVCWSAPLFHGTSVPVLTPTLGAGYRRSFHLSYSLSGIDVLLPMCAILVKYFIAVAEVWNFKSSNSLLHHELLLFVNLSDTREIRAHPESWSVAWSRNHLLFFSLGFSLLHNVFKFVFPKFVANCS